MQLRQCKKVLSEYDRLFEYLKEMLCIENSEDVVYAVSRLIEREKIARCLLFGVSEYVEENKEMRGVNPLEDGKEEEK